MIYRPAELSETGQAWYPLVKQQVGSLPPEVFNKLPANSLNRLKFNLAEMLEKGNKLTVGELNALKAAGTHIDDIVISSKSEFPTMFAGSGNIQKRIDMQMENILAALESGGITPGRAAKLKNVIMRQQPVSEITQKMKDDEGIQTMLRYLMDKGL